MASRRMPAADVAGVLETAAWVGWIGVGSDAEVGNAALHRPPPLRSEAARAHAAPARARGVMACKQSPVRDKAVAGKAGGNGKERKTGTHQRRRRREWAKLWWLRRLWLWWWGRAAAASLAWVPSSSRHLRLVVGKEHVFGLNVLVADVPLMEEAQARQQLATSAK